MGRLHMFSQDDEGNTHRVKVDPKNIDKQMREERVSGRTPTVLDDDDMIRFGRLTQQAIDKNV